MNSDALSRDSLLSMAQQRQVILLHWNHGRLLFRKGGGRMARLLGLKQGSCSTLPVAC
jgi:hypothetical protein